MMEEEYMESQDAATSDVNRNADGLESTEPKDFADVGGFDDGYEEDDGGNNFRGNRGRGNFRNRGRGPPPPGWMNGPPMRFRGRGYGPGGPPMRGRGFFRGRGGPRFGPNGGPNFDSNWGPMGPPPPGMMGGPPPFGPPPGMMPPGGPMGPPPNMMGQPPPFGGPPGMPPPNMPAPELWVETKTDEDKSYYYHSRTRETTWTRPQEGPNVKVITQAEMEVMAGNQLNMNAGSMPMNGPMGGPMGGPPMGMMPNGMMGGMMPPQGSQPVPGVPPFLQPPPWGKGAKDNKDEPATAEADEMPPGETAPGTQPANGAMGGFPGGPGGPGAPGGPGGFPGGFPGGAPPGGFPGWGGWGGWPPPLVAQPPPGLAAAAVPDASAATQMPPPESQPPVHAPPQHQQLQQHQTMQHPHQQHQPLAPPHLQPPPLQHQKKNQQPPPHQQPPQQNQPPQQPDKPPQRPQPPPKKEPTVIPPEVAARAAEWTTHRAPDGRPYYYRASKQESVWEKPKPLRELEELKAKIALEKGEKDKKVETIVLDDKTIEVIDVDAHAEAAAAAEAERRAAAEREKEKERAAAAEKERLEKERQDKEKQEKEAADKEKAKQDRRLPISTTPISGTPWCLVWTGDGRVFFHNPTALSSVWERPPQLVGRADVDHALSHPPAELLDLLRKDSAAGATTAAATATAGKAANGEMKRAAEKSESDSDAEPPKKPKPEESKKASTIDVGKEAAIEAEVRAARERGVVPHEQRLRSFLQMLHEKDVSAFSTWEKELHKIVFDPRYLMLNSKERRQVFDQYVRERAEEERKEKKNRLQQKKLAFKQLMEEAKLHSKSSFTEFSSKHGRDERFKGIEKPRDRETCFNEYIADVRKREKDEKDKKREQVKADFIALLKEKSIDRHARWADTKKKIDSDARYKAVETSSLREDYFREYCKIIKEERKKDKDGKDKERASSKKDKKDKERGDKDKEKDKDKDKERDKESKKDKKKDKAEKEQPSAEQMDTEEAEAGGAGGEEEAAARQREARAQASIKEREREVQRALATSLRDRDKEREYHKRDEAVQHFNALLADLVRNPDLTWREAKKQLKKDHRYSLAELLSKDDKERLFGQHTSALANKRRDKLRALLTELNVSCTAHWRDVRDQLAAEPTAPVYSSATQMEREFRDYQRDKQSAAKTALRQLLLETRSITHKSLAALKENPAAEQHIHDALKHDARYLALEHIPDERQQMILGYLEELEKKGPPPPPTATEPTRRTKQ